VYKKIVLKVLGHRQKVAQNMAEGLLLGSGRLQTLKEQNGEVNPSEVEPAERVYTNPRCATIPLGFEGATQGRMRSSLVSALKPSSLNQGNIW
jgi:hypothetical protein